MSGKIWTSVKGCLDVLRLTSDLDPLLPNETINNTVTAPLDHPPHPEGETLQSFNLKSFHFNELKLATKNFRPDRFPNEAGFGSVYKGWIDEHLLIAAKPGTGMAIVVKLIHPQSTLQSHEEWMTEVNCLGQLVHPNIVKMIGYCLEDDIQLLVYECMPNGGLETHLFRGDLQPLSWILRMKIAVGAAKGLAFLHSEAKVIHGDFKTSKILLDLNHNAKLHGYGVSEEGRDGYRHATQSFDYYYEAPWYVPPGYEYVAPELIRGGKARLTPKSDVYSFGAVLLEILCSRAAIHRGKGSLVHMAVQKWSREKRIHHIIDTQMEAGQYSKAAAVEAVNLAIQCLENQPGKRPDMNQVVELLEELHASSVREHLGYLRMKVIEKLNATN